jgi:hypothetical protein
MEGRACTIIHNIHGFHIKIMAKFASAYMSVRRQKNICYVKLLADAARKFL